jgi:hypothetical protein
MGAPTVFYRMKRGIRRLLFPEKRLIVVLASAHKVGSTWLFNLLRDLGGFEGPALPPALNDTGTLLLETGESSDFLGSQTGKKIFKSHSFPIPAEKRGGAKFISVYRDPRDVVISGTFYLANLDKARGGWGDELRHLSDKEKIRHFIATGGWCIDRLKAWFNDGATCQVKYEQLLADTRGEVERVVNFLGIRASDKRISEIIEKNSFQKKSGRKTGEEDRSSFFRKGISGDWKNYFDEELKQHFKTALNGRWNELLVEMGYEQQLDW